jgi:ribosome-binding factor A
MVSEARAGRIARRIQEELSVILLTEANDPRLGGAFVTDVNVDRELAFASVYLSAVEGAERSEEILAGMESASGFLRSALAKRIELRTFPRLRFYWDPTPENADRIDRLLASLSDDPDDPDDPDEKDQTE